MFAAIAALLSSSVSAAVEAPVQTSLGGAHAVAVTIDSENLIELYQSVPGLRIIDTRLHQDHLLGHMRMGWAC